MIYIIPVQPFKGNDLAEWAIVLVRTLWVLPYKAGMLETGAHRRGRTFRCSWSSAPLLASDPRPAPWARPPAHQTVTSSIYNNNHYVSLQVTTVQK